MPRLGPEESIFGRLRTVELIESPERIVYGLDKVSCLCSPPQHVRTIRRTLSSKSASRARHWRRVMRNRSYLPPFFRKEMGPW